jgi:hypothetical protein
VQVGHLGHAQDHVHAWSRIHAWCAPCFAYLGSRCHPLDGGHIGRQQRARAAPMRRNPVYHGMGHRPAVSAPRFLFCCGCAESLCTAREAANWVSGSVTQEQHVAGLGTQSGGLYAGKSKGDVFLVGGQMDRCLLGCCMHQGHGLRAGTPPCHSRTRNQLRVRLIYHIAECTCEGVEMHELELEGSSRSGAQGRGRP